MTSQDNSLISQPDAAPFCNRISRRSCRHGLNRLGIAFLVAIGLFAAFPHLDSSISALFGSQSDAFSLGHNPMWEAARQFFILVTNGTMIAFLLCWLVMRLRPALAKTKAAMCQIAGFCALAYALIPGVLVNGVIKPIWGRARPRNILEFGGTESFSSPFELSDQCAQACSFVSGEASALFTCATLALLFIVPALPAGSRWLATTAIFSLAFIGSGLRIVVGAHFLSDVVFAAILSSAMVLMMYLRFSASVSSAGTTPH
jgi:lipid A 4'-phosphatase